MFRDVYLPWYLSNNNMFGTILKLICCSTIFDFQQIPHGEPFLLVGSQINRGVGRNFTGGWGGVVLNVNFYKGYFCTDLFPNTLYKKCVESPPPFPTPLIHFDPFVTTIYLGSGTTCVCRSLLGFGPFRLDVLPRFACSPTTACVGCASAAAVSEKDSLIKTSSRDHNRQSHWLLITNTWGNNLCICISNSHRPIPLI